MTSRGRVRPWVIESVFLFDARDLVAKLVERKVRIGVATSVAQRLWETAEVYPVPGNTKLVLSDEQRKLLGLFHSNASDSTQRKQKKPSR
jgi:hypothetical protein